MRRAPTPVKGGTCWKPCTFLLLSVCLISIVPVAIAKRPERQWNGGGNCGAPRQSHPGATERLSDGVFAVYRLLVLELGPERRFQRLRSGQMAKHAVSYLFIAIVWTNHHHLMPMRQMPRLAMWFNFTHVFRIVLFRSQPLGWP